MKHRSNFVTEEDKMIFIVIIFIIIIVIIVFIIIISIIITIIVIIIFIIIICFTYIISKGSYKITTIFDRNRRPPKNLQAFSEAHLSL